jgi:cysteine synthase A
MMRALGAEVALVEQTAESRPGEVSGPDLELVEETAQRITRERGAFRADQFRHAGNFRAHYLHTGPEIWQQTGGAFDAFCDFAGTGGTFAGCAAAFRERGSPAECWIVEPQCAQHRIQGGGYGIPLPLLERARPDGVMRVSDSEAIETARRLAREEGIFAGFSSGANVAAALRLAERGRTVVTVVNDSGLKYLSTDLWD